MTNFGESSEGYSLGNTTLVDLRSQEETQRLEDDIRSASYKILDVGPGYEPIQSVDLNSGDVLVMAEPALKTASIKQGRMRNNERSKRLLVRDSVDAIPTFGADLVLMIAPNPEDIVNGLLYQLEKFLKSGTQFFILLDNRTVESQRYGLDAKRKIMEFFKENGIKTSELNLDGRKIDTSGSRDAVGGTVFKAIKK